MIIHNENTAIESFYIKNDNAYNYNRLRTGLFTKESKYFLEKYKINNLLDIFNKLNINYNFDSFNNSDNSQITFTLSGTNYGVILRATSANFQIYLFNKYFKNKKNIEQHINIDLNYKDSCFKYNNSNNVFNKKIKKLAVISSAAKHKIIDWNLLNNFMNDEDTYLKTHPIMDKNTKIKLAKKYGNSKIIESSYTLDPLIEKADTVAVSACSESLLTINLLNKNIVFLNKPYLNFNKVISTYFILYYSLYNKISLKEILNNYSIGLIPWKYLNDKNFIFNLINFNITEYENWKNFSYNYTI